ncbi:MAG: ABC transporter permease [Bryobacteraceae bacterium]|nr:ABC transporter permease [Bryobacteraceae bacterium]
MTLPSLAARSLSYYKRTNAAVVLGVATAVAVLSGALLVGESVRASLGELVLQRLGRTHAVLSSALFFREMLAQELKDAAPLVALEGVVVNGSDKRRVTGVSLYGVDDRFWKFHQVAGEAPADREAHLSEALAAELGLKSGDALLVRLEKPSAIAKESLHGRKEDSSRTIRFTVGRVLPPSQLGEFSLKPAQGSVFAAFLPLKRLQKDLGQPGKVNAILLGSPDPNWRKAVTLADVGVRLRGVEAQDAISVESESAVVNDDLLEATRKAAGAQPAYGVFSYLANEIRTDRASVPYSLITAMDRRLLPAGLDDRSIVLNTWAAADLGAKVGDPVHITYYLWDESGALLTREASFRLHSIVPIAGFAADRDLSPEYPGITEAETLGDWDPPFPMDLKKVRPKDEDYWKRYRTTPKAFLTLEAGQKLWQSRFGKLTSVRVSGVAQLQTFRTRLRAQTDPASLGMGYFQPRSEGLAASRGSTDFGEYFTYFSFFLVVSAMLLTALFFQLGIEQRLREIGTLKALGFSAAHVRRLFLTEGVLLALTGTAAGSVLAIGYAQFLIYGLTHWWSGAVGTSLLRLHVSPAPLVSGAVAGIAVALVCIVLTLRALRRITPRGLLTGSRPETGVAAGKLRVPRITAVTAGLLAITGIALGLAALIPDAGAFFGGGSLLLVAALAYLLYLLRSSSGSLVGAHGVLRLGFRNAGYRPGRSILAIALIASATFLVVALEAFRQPEASPLDPRSGTGGYPLLAEAQLPLFFDLNTESGRESLNLTSGDWSKVEFVPFRLRPGDDASCLNLYEPRNPRVLGAPKRFLDAARFSFASSLAENDAEKANPWLLLNRAGGESIPAAVDANSLQYVLHKKLGDEIVLNAGTAAEVRLRVVAALRNSIFQSELIVSEDNFKKAFPEQQGFRAFLIAASDPAAASKLLEESLEDYGLDVTSSPERLAAYHRVENTYLSTFQALGGLGLLLGTLGLAAVLLRNVLERRRELALLQAVGFQRRAIGRMVLAENLYLLACGIGIGAACAAIAILPAFLSRGGHRPDISLAILILAVPAAAVLASLAAVRAVVRMPLLETLRAE